MKVNSHIQNISVLILTPTANDGNLVREILQKVDLDTILCRSLDELTDLIQQHYGPAVIAEEGLGDHRQARQFLKALATQPSWSSVPLLVFKSRESVFPYTQKLASEYNCIIQKRPIHLPTFISAVQSAVHAYQRQLEVKQKNELLDEARRYAESIIETIEEAIVVLDADLIVKSANKMFYETFQQNPNQVVGRCVYELANSQWQTPELKKLLERVLPEQKSVDGYEIQYPGKKGTVHLLLNAKQLKQNEFAPQHILLAFHDITPHKIQEQILKDLTEQLLLAEENQRQKIATALHDSIGQLLAFSKREVSTLLKDPRLQSNSRLKKYMIL